MAAVTENWLRAFESDSVEPVVVVEIHLTVSDVRRYTSDYRAAEELQAETGDQYLPLVAEVDTVGVSFDPLNGKVDIGSEYTVLLEDDTGVEDEARELVANEDVHGRRVTMKLGAVGLAEVDYADLWGGTLEETVPSTTSVEFKVMPAWKILVDREIRRLTPTTSQVSRTHPYEEMEQLFGMADVEGAMIDSTAFDPDTAANAAIGHWVIARGVMGIDDRNIKAGEKVLDLVLDLARITNSVVLPLHSGALTVRRYDPTAPSVDSWVEGEDFEAEDFDQVETHENLINHAIVNAGWLGTSGAQDTRGRAGTAEVNANSSKRSNEGDFRYALDRVDDASALRHNSDGGVTLKRQVTETIESRWTGVQSQLEAAILSGVSPGVGGTFDLSGGWLDAFTGFRKDDGDAGEWEVTDSRRAFILIETEIIAVDLITQGSGSGTFPVLGPDGEPAPTIDYDFATAEMRVIERGAHGTVAAAHPVGANAVDVTLMLEASDGVMKRWIDGVPICKIRTGLDKHKVDAGEIIDITTPQYLAKGANGAVALKFQVISKQVTAIGDSAGIDWIIARAPSDTVPANPNIPVVIKVGLPGQMSKWLEGQEILKDFTSEGLGLFDSGLDLTIDPGKMKIASSLVAPSAAITNALTANETTHVSYDGERHAFIYRDSTVGPPDDQNPFSLPIASVSTNASAVTATEDLTDIVGIVGPKISGYTGPEFADFPIPERYTDGQTIQVADGSPGGKTYRLDQLASPYATEVIADSPDIYWRLDETVGTTATDSSGNGNDGTYRNAPLLDQAPLILQGVGTLLEAGRSVDFNNAVTNEDVQLAAYAGLAGATAFTVEAWVKFSDGDSTLVSWQTSHELRVYFNESGAFPVRVTVDGVDYDFAASTIVGNLNDGNIHHVVITWDGIAGTLRLYIDGAQESVIDGTVAKSVTLGGSGELLVGQNVDALPAAEAFNGFIDEFALYTTELSSERIREHYRIGRDGPRRWIPTEPVNQLGGLFDQLISGDDIVKGGLCSAIRGAIDGRITRDSLSGTGKSTGDLAKIGGAGPLAIDGFRVSCEVTGQVVGAVTLVPINYDTTKWDSANIFNITTDVGTIPANGGGMWVLFCSGAFQQERVNKRFFVEIQVNTGTGFKTGDAFGGGRGQSLLMPFAQGNLAFNAISVNSLKAGDTFRFQIFNGDNKVQTVTVNPAHTWAGGFRIPFSEHLQ